MRGAALADFPWPKVGDSPAAPVWRGDHFLVGEEKRRILAYDVSESHWSSELTALHEEEAGADHPIDRASRRLAVESINRFLTKQEPLVLDVGCSSGYVVQEIAKARPDAELMGSDYILPPLQQLAERMPALPILQFDLRRCPLPDECVDAVTALNVLEHIDEDEKALAHVFRILRPGGVAHIEVPAGPGLFDVYDQHLMHHRRYRLHDLIQMARRAGFEILQATHLGFFAYPGFWMVKKRNRLKGGKWEKEAAAEQVKSHIRETRGSTLMGTLFELEQKLGRRWSFPFGIRCVLVGRKPGLS